MRIERFLLFGPFVSLLRLLVVNFYLYCSIGVRRVTSDTNDRCSCSCDEHRHIATILSHSVEADAIQLMTGHRRQFPGVAVVL